MRTHSSLPAFLSLWRTHTFPTSSSDDETFPTNSSDNETTIQQCRRVKQSAGSAIPRVQEMGPKTSCVRLHMIPANRGVATRSASPEICIVAPRIDGHGTRTDVHTFRKAVLALPLSFPSDATRTRAWVYLYVLSKGVDFSSACSNMHWLTQIT